MRKALGMSGAQLARKMGVSRALVSQAESNEVSGNVTMKTMQTMAEAMGCRFVYAVLPPKGKPFLPKPETGKEPNRQTPRWLENQSVPKMKSTHGAAPGQQMAPGSGMINDVCHLSRRCHHSIPMSVMAEARHITTQGELNELEQANIIAGLRWRTPAKPDVLSDAFAFQLKRLGEVWIGPKLRQTERISALIPCTSPFN
jgi:transcriptional regulator with XRE-family HTH domain